MQRRPIETAWPHVDPGKKRHKINIEQQSPGTRDEYGEVAGPWLPILTDCWAAIDTKSISQPFQGGFVSQVFHLISFDWPRVHIGTDMRVVVSPLRGSEASVYVIQGVENVQQRNLVIILTCIQIDDKKVGP